MEREFWLDGFNFFHHWESTRGLMRSDSGVDIVRAIDRSLRILSRYLGRKCSYTVVYLDGGLSWHESRAAGLRVRYCGPGRKADDRLVEDLAELGQSAKLVTAISNDRELKGNMRAHGASCLGVSEFLSVIEGRKTGSGKGKGKKGGATRPVSGGDAAEIMRQKTRTLSPAEVKAWLDYFGGDVEME